MAVLSVSPRFRTVTAAGIATAVWTYDGPDRAASPGQTYLFIHGLRGTHEGLAVLAQAVLAQQPGASVVVPDLPGFGETALPADGGRLDLRRYDAWLGDLWHRCGLDARTVLLGHSFGSLLTSHAVASGAIAPHALLLVNPVARAPRTGVTRIPTALATAYYRFGDALPERAGRRVLSAWPFVQGMSSIMCKSHDLAVRRWVHAQHHEYFSRFASCGSVTESYELSTRHGVSDWAHDVRVPVLLVCGARDEITGPRVQRRLASKLPNAELVMLSGVGHLIHYERPQAAGAAIVRFVEGLGAMRG